MRATPGLEASGGLLGLGLAQAQGHALALRLQDAEASRVYCIIGDGEATEGGIGRRRCRLPIFASTT